MTIREEVDSMPTAKRRTSKSAHRPRKPPIARKRRAPVIPPPADVETEPGVPDTPDLAETARPADPVTREIIGLAAGDIDASWQGVESGEEAVGGSTPTPDQDNVDQIGSALGVVEQDEKPLATTEKIEGRDRDRWELDPASAEDLEERERDEAQRRRRHEP
jgi:hypothetical protein